MTEHDLKSVLSAFQVEGTLAGAEPFGGGHINDSYLVSMKREDGSTLSYILQRINHHVFKQPEQMMENIQRVTEHLKNRTGSAFRSPLYLIPTHEDQCYFRDAEGNYWRTFNFIEGSHTHDEIESIEQAYQGARAFGQLQHELADLPGEALHETIPDFHNTPKRYESFECAVREGNPERVAHAGPEIKMARDMKQYAPVITNLLTEGKIPPRVTHNDTKLNNVLFCQEGEEALCVIDLDTLMTGSALYDFGDYVRSAARLGAEDEPDLTNVRFSPEYYEACLRGYLETAGDELTLCEKDNLAISAVVITYELGLRFLTDYLLGDHYFKTTHSSHNLERARVQFKMAQEILSHLPELNQQLKSFDMLD